MSKERIKAQKGITLIALIITIIVMLILVGVSVTVALNGGLFSTAQQAKSETQLALEREQLLSIALGAIGNNGEVVFAELDEAIKADGTFEGTEGIYTSKKSGNTYKVGSNASITGGWQQEGSHNWNRNGDILTCKCDSCLTLSEEGISFELGEVVNYTDNGSGSSSLDGQKSGVSQGITDGKLTASDYGTDGNQTITKDADTKWVVLGIEDKDNNGTNETLLLTSEIPTMQKLTLYGGNPYYYNVDEELDRMCKEIYGENARSIDADDVNEVLEYTPTGGIYYPATVGAYLSTGNFTTKISDLTDDYYNMWNSTERLSILYSSGGTKRTTFYTPEYQNGTSDENNLGKYIVNGYWYLRDDSITNPHTLPVLSSTTSSVAKNIVFGNSELFRYHLSCKGEAVNNTRVYFGLGKVSNNNVQTFSDTYHSLSGGRNMYDASLRPVLEVTDGIYGLW